MHKMFHFAHNDITTWCEMEIDMRKRGWILLLVLLCVAFLMSCGKDTEPDEAKGELVRIEREGCQDGVLLFFSVGEPRFVPARKLGDCHDNG